MLSNIQQIVNDELGLSVRNKLNALITRNNSADARYLRSSENLGDLTDVVVARTRLGLGTASVRDAADTVDATGDAAALPDNGAVADFVAERGIITRRRALPTFLADGSLSHLTMPLLAGLGQATMILRLTVPLAPPGSDVGIAALSNTATIPTESSTGTNGAHAIVAYFATNGDLVIRKYNAAMDGHREAAVAWASISALAGQDVCVAVYLHADGSPPTVYIGSTTALSATVTATGTSPPSDFSGFASDHLHFFASISTHNRMLGPVYGDILLLGMELPLTLAAAELTINYSLDLAMADVPLSIGAARGIPFNGPLATLTLDDFVPAGGATVSSTTATSATGLSLPAGQDFRRNGGGGALFNSTVSAIRVKFTVANFADPDGTANVVITNFVSYSSDPIGADGDYEIVIPRTNQSNFRMSIRNVGTGTVTLDISNWTVEPLGAVARLSAADLVYSNLVTATIVDRSGSGKTATVTNVQRLN